MRKDELSLIRCPFSNTPIKIGDVLEYDEKSKKILFGTIYSEYEEYPIIDGIIYFKRLKLRKLVTLIKDERYFEAIFLLLTRRNLPFSNFFYQPSVKMIFDINIFLKILKNNIFITKLILKVLLSSGTAKYYMERNQLKDSLQFFIPALFLKNSKVKQFWLDIGSGVHNYYGYLPKVNFIAIDPEFTNHFFSQILFPDGKVLRFCMQGEYSACLNKKFDVISFNDSLQYITDQKVAIENSQKMLSNNGILLATNLPEKLYSYQDDLYPIKRKVLRKFFWREVIFFSTSALSKLISSDEKVTLKSATIGVTQAVFRYTVLFLKNKKNNWAAKIPNEVVPVDLRKQAKHLWIRSEPVWRNRVY